MIDATYKGPSVFRENPFFPGKSERQFIHWLIEKYRANDDDPATLSKWLTMKLQDIDFRAVHVLEWIKLQ